MILRLELAAPTLFDRRWIRDVQTDDRQAHLDLIQRFAVGEEETNLLVCRRKVHPAKTPQCRWLFLFAPTFGGHLFTVELNDLVQVRLDDEGNVCFGDA